MLYYQAVCHGEFGKTPPFTLFVTTDRSEDALVWNQGIQMWQYDPARVVRFTADYNNDDRYEAVDRVTAEKFARQLAVDGSPVSELPSEDWIEWFFAWKGDPPDHEDVSWNDDLHVRELQKRAARDDPDS